MRKLAKIFLAILLFTGTAHGAAFQFGGLRLDAVKVTSSGSATVLTSADKQMRVTTGSAADTQKLPDATTLQAGYWYWFNNESSGTLTVSNSSSAQLTTLNQNESALLVVTSTGTSGGPWSVYKAVASSSSSVPTSEVAVDSGNGNGSTNTKIRRFSNTRKNAGSDITYADSATLGGSFTINTTGIYTACYNDSYSVGVAALAISVNDSAPTDWSPPTYAQGTRAISSAPSGNWGQVCWTGHLSATDVVRAHNNSNVDNSGVGCMFTITRIQ